MVDVGAGQPLVLVPGIQGRWEWMRPAVEALSRSHRVITASLPGEPGAGMRFEQGAGFELFVAYLDRLLDSAGVARAILCGVSFGGLIALRYAAVRPHRVLGLILVSTPGPGWTLNRQQARYVRWPTVTSPLFAAGAVGRFRRELRALFPRRRDRLAACARTAWRVATAPAIPGRMGRRVRMAEQERFEPDCARVAVPTLIVTGERALDQVVPCDATMLYVDLIPGSRFQLFERTGHLGLVLAPDRFAAIVSGFTRTL